jgi:hypothetical protein
MLRRFLQLKEADCPAIILFRYFDRETIRIFEDDYIAYLCKELLARLTMHRCQESRERIQ